MPTYSLRYKGKVYSGITASSPDEAKTIVRNKERFEQIPQGGGELVDPDLKAANPNFPASDSFFENARTAFGRKFVRAGQGIQQALATGEEDQRLSEQAERQKRLDAPLMQSPGSTTGDIAGSVAIAAPMTAALGMAAPATLAVPAAGASLAAKAVPYLGAAALSGVQSGLLDPTAESESTLGKTASGAAWGLGGQGVSELGLAGAGKLAGYGKGVSAGKWKNQVAQALDDYAKQHGINMRVGDLAPTGVMRRLEGLAEYLPFSGMRDKIETEQAEPLKRLIHALSQRFNKGGYQDVPEASQAVISGMDERLEGVKKAGNILYQRVTDLVRKRGAPPINPANTQKAVKELLEEYPNTLGQLGDAKLASEMQRLVDVKSGSDPVLKFEQTKWLRERLNERMRAAMKGAAPVGNKQARAIAKVFDALDDDVSAWSKSDPALASAWERARKFWGEQVGPYKSRDNIRRVMDENYAPERLASQAFGTDKGSVARDVLGATTPKGRDAAKFIALQRADDAATDPSLASGLSTQRFMRNTDLGNTGRELFSPHELGDIERARLLVGSLPRAAHYMDDPATGARTIPLQAVNSVGSALAGGGGLAMGGLPAALTALATTVGAGKAITGLSTSDLGKRLLMAEANQQLDPALARLLSAYISRPVSQSMSE